MFAQAEQFTSTLLVGKQARKNCCDKINSQKEYCREYFRMIQDTKSLWFSHFANTSWNQDQILIEWGPYLNIQLIFLQKNKKVACFEMKYSFHLLDSSISSKKCVRTKCFYSYRVLILSCYWCFTHGITLHRRVLFFIQRVLDHLEKVKLESSTIVATWKIGISLSSTNEY